MVSMQRAQTEGSNWRYRSSTSLKATNETLGTSGSKGSRYLACPVVEREPKVRPWNEPSRARKRDFPGFAEPLVPALLDWPYARAIFSAPSQASVPLLQKKARSRPEAWVRTLASCAWYS